jgi:hypothetical protein
MIRQIYQAERQIRRNYENMLDSRDVAEVYAKIAGGALALNRIVDAARYLEEIGGNTKEELRKKDETIETQAAEIAELLEEIERLKESKA